jgi:hypothetical protein
MPLKFSFYFLAVCTVHATLSSIFSAFYKKSPPPIFFGAEDTILPSVPEMKFLDIKLIKDLRLLCYSQSFFWRILMKTRLFSGLKILTKFRET